MSAQMATIGHNSNDLSVSVTVRAFNSLVPFCPSSRLNKTHHYPVGTTLAEIARDFNIPFDEIFLILVNGRDIAPGLVGDVRLGYCVDEGDVIAFSGPVPYSFGYGAPVV